MGTPYAEVIGDPVGHSRSPSIHKFWLDALGLDGDYRATRVTAGALPEYFAKRREDPDWRGCNVTVPHKQAVMPFVDALSPLAHEVGAVNLITRDTRLSADNSDVHGIIASLPASMLPSRRLSACLIGSGGAARAALAAFRRMPIATVNLNVRDPAKGKMLLDEFAFEGRCGAIDDEENLARADVIVNATTLGMVGQAPMPESLLRRLDKASPETVVFDMVYTPLETDLLRAAAGAGLRAVDGLTMLIGQASAAFERFFGVQPPREEDEGLRRLLTS